MDVDAVAVDFGNVLVEVDFRRAFAVWGHAAGVSPSVLGERFSLDDAYHAHERGEIDAPRYFASLRKNLELDISDEDMLAGWNAIFGEPLPGIETLVRRIARCWPLYVFSNTNPAHVAHFRPRYGALLSHFTGIVTSCDIGRRKPEPEAFARLAELAGVPPARLAFFDDLEENVAGARRAGLIAHRVTTPAALSALLLDHAHG
ncbi:MAG TPA: HAD family phosphatase [Burkholderiales bacterium]|nr:HAD family phosphatase [Burkholderiales bacterium]